MVVIFPRGLYGDRLKAPAADPTDRFWPILLKKSAMVSTVEKYAFEVEICTLIGGFGAQISRSDAQ
ncbi:hypothetical protein [Pseudomonas karstica]|uniref:hypothetical protein n=1 Tax=Pseudomonas karstica TaxID=1055468 RepID=UPI0015B73844|nr:hypothetical protein [Pseudomonas karstica]